MGFEPTITEGRGFKSHLGSDFSESIFLLEYHVVVLIAILNSSEKGLNGDLNPDLCHAGAVLYQLSSQPNWEKGCYAGQL